ncbi:uncharacterized protein MKK02DRAFT_28709 [Dioszegia hungarica]|uniref:Protein CPL1-like domain-containing protein n=1 Tax=Dioszegia hungarica TaxID=4972 RepID=A0AA38LSD0_9TREE|nr:uncharacterized protein MKK02DRAFT_28709 [Dioszegia hungarica]KAI9633975.1 hypothetical protein MKK02DRAFT_28709 [Dioszegia hungarica]
MLCSSRARLLQLVLVGFAIIPTYAVNDIFSGCYTILPSGSALSSPATQSSSSACTLACPNNSHSYYKADTQACYCSNGTPNEQYLVAGNRDGCGTNYENRITKTSFMEVQPLCYASKPAGITTASNQYPTGLGGCLNACRFSLRAHFFADTPGNRYACFCGMPTSYSNPVTCGPDTYFSYYHTPEAAASGLARRNRREELAARKAELAKLFCPLGRTACRVQGVEDAYECIDTKTELESCGGCRWGEYASSASSNVTIGEDCSSMTAIARGGATCTNGRCTAFACRRGYELEGGRILGQGGSSAHRSVWVHCDQYTYTKARSGEQLAAYRRDNQGRKSSKVGAAQLHASEIVSLLATVHCRPGMRRTQGTSELTVRARAQAACMPAP